MISIFAKLQSSFLIFSFKKKKKKILMFWDVTISFIFLSQCRNDAQWGTQRPHLGVKQYNLLISFPIISITQHHSICGCKYQSAISCILQTHNFIFPNILSDILPHSVLCFTTNTYLQFSYSVTCVTYIHWCNVKG